MNAFHERQKARLLLLTTGRELATRLEAAGNDSTPLLAFLHAVDAAGGPEAAAPLWAPLKAALQRLAIREGLPTPPSIDATPGTEQSEGAGTQAKAPAPATATETVDATGYVTNPSDPTAYVAATDVLRNHTPAALATTHKQLRSILNKYPTIRRWQVRENRLRVHLADWMTYVRKETSNVGADGLLADELEIEARKAELRRKKPPGK